MVALSGKEEQNAQRAAHFEAHNSFFLVDCKQQAVCLQKPKTKVSALFRNSCLSSLLFVCSIVVVVVDRNGANCYFSLLSFRRMDENTNNNSGVGLLVVAGTLVYTNAFPEISEALGKILFFLLFSTWKVIDTIEGLTEEEKNTRKFEWVAESLIKIRVILEHLHRCTFSHRGRGAAVMKGMYDATHRGGIWFRLSAAEKGQLCLIMAIALVMSRYQARVAIDQVQLYHNCQVIKNILAKLNIPLTHVVFFQREWLEALVDFAEFVPVDEETRAAAEAAFNALEGDLFEDDQAGNGNDGNDNGGRVRPRNVLGML